MRRALARVSTAAFAAAALAASFATTARARTEPAYCAVSRGQGMNYQDCRYATLADCLEEIRGLGGHCQPNPRYVAPEAPQNREPASRRRPGQ